MNIPRRRQPAHGSPPLHLTSPVPTSKILFSICLLWDVAISSGWQMNATMLQMRSSKLTQIRAALPSAGPLVRYCDATIIHKVHGGEGLEESNASFRC